MVNRPRDFRHHDVVRAIRAAQAAGLANPTVKIRVPSGTEYYVSGGEVEAPAKKSKERDTNATFAEGGGSNKMLGAGDRTKTAGTDAAGKQQPGSTGHRTVSRGSKLAEGGKKTAPKTLYPSGGMARPARGGQTGC